MKELDEYIEELADIEHQRWADWQRWVHDESIGHPDGLIIPQDLVNRWERQINTPYSKLSEKEKQSDRNQVQRYLPTIKKLMLDTLKEVLGEPEFEKVKSRVVNDVAIFETGVAEQARNQLRQSALKKLEEKLTTDND